MRWIISKVGNRSTHGRKSKLDSTPAISEELAEGRLTGSQRWTARRRADALIYRISGTSPSRIPIGNLVVDEDATGLNAGVWASGGTEQIAAIAPGASPIEGSLLSVWRWLASGRYQSDWAVKFCAGHIG